MSGETIKNTILVSIVVPTYNRAYCLKRTIQSVLDQTLSNWELILVDNHSTDDTDDLVTSYADPRIKYLKIHNEGVIAASRNKGIKAASGKYLAFLDSDDWWVPKKLEKSVQALEAGADFVYHDLYIMHPSWVKPRSWKRTRLRHVFEPVFRDLLLNGTAICTSSVVVRYEFMETIGGFSEDRNLIATEDYDAWLRVSKLTDAFVMLPDCLGYYMVGADNMSSAERTIVNVKRILELYGNEIHEQVGDIPGWMSYSLASSFYKKRKYDISKLYAIKVIKCRSSIRLKMRSIAILLLISLRALSRYHQ